MRNCSFLRNRRINLVHFNKICSIRKHHFLFPLALQSHQSMQQLSQEVKVCLSSQLEIVICLYQFPYFKGTKKQHLISMFWITGERNHSVISIYYTRTHSRCKKMAKAVIPGTMCLGCCHCGPQGTEAGWILLIPTPWQSTLTLIHHQAQGCAVCWEESGFAQPHLWE